MKITPFDFADYKEYLKKRLETSGSSRGLRSKLAKHLRCQMAFISQVLRGSAHFSLEHGAAINAFLAHSPKEAHFFMLLLHECRAGTEALKNYYKDQRLEIQKEREEVKERLQISSKLPTQMQEKYYSAWYFSAIHVLLSVPGFQTPESIVTRLQIPIRIVEECLECLTAAGLAVMRGGKYHIGTTRIHLGKDSPWLPRHHINWRMRAISALDLPAPNELHYSSVISLSNRDAAKIKSMLLATLEETEPILKDSKEENIYCMALDFFTVK